MTPLVLAAHAQRAHDARVREQSRAGREDGGAHECARREEIALPYHGSLSRERRLTLEQALKAGELRALVTTSSLELGIDIGSVDLVIQLQIAEACGDGLQRVGRAGHSLDAVSRGVFVPTFRDDAHGDARRRSRDARGRRRADARRAECARRAGAGHRRDRRVDDDWTSATLFDFVRRAYPYHQLTRAAFDEVLAMLSGKYPSDVAAELDARLTWDRVTDTLTRRAASRMIAVISGGTIPDRGLYTVNLPDRTRLGELDEEFVHESRVGDVFQLGSSTWRIGVDRARSRDRDAGARRAGADALLARRVRGAVVAARAARRRAASRARRGAHAPNRSRRSPRSYDADEATTTSLVEYVQQQRAVDGRSCPTSGRSSSSSSATRWARCASCCTRRSADA